VTRRGGDCAGVRRRCRRLRAHPRHPSRETFAFWDDGLELSRRFRALKLWATLRFHGAHRLAAAIAEDIRLAAHLADLVALAEDFELLAGPGLSVCCFRHAPTHVDDPALDAHNERILHALQRDGRVYLSSATIDGRFALRACITNFRTTQADVERVLTVIRELAGGPGRRRFA
jgi:aromatic-L-amino-acid/L-tryptophan decarboxylase